MVRINTVFDEELLRELDRIARVEHKSRSRLLREAAEMLVEAHRREQEEKRRRGRVSRAMEVQDRIREKAGDWEGTSELRHWRDRRR